MSSFLLDTNAIIAVMNESERISTKIITAENIYLPVIAVGEIFYGVEKSAKTEENKKRIENFINTLAILDCDIEVAKIFGRIEQNLRSKGCPIPQNDVWITAIASEHDLILLTKDKHFDNVGNLKTQDL